MSATKLDYLLKEKTMETETKWLCRAGSGEGIEWEQQDTNQKKCLGM